MNEESKKQKKLGKPYLYLTKRVSSLSVSPNNQLGLQADVLPEVLRGPPNAVLAHHWPPLGLLRALDARLGNHMMIDKQLTSGSCRLSSLCLKQALVIDGRAGVETGEDRQVPV